MDLKSRYSLCLFFLFFFFFFFLVYIYTFVRHLRLFCRLGELVMTYCLNPEYLKASECKECSSSRMKVSVPAQLGVPERCLYRYLGTVKKSNGM